MRGRNNGWRRPLFLPEYRFSQKRQKEMRGEDQKRISFLPLLSLFWQRKRFAKNSWWELKIFYEDELNTFGLAGEIRVMRMWSN